MWVWWLAALVAFDHASVAADRVPPEALGLGDSPAKPSGLIDLDEDVAAEEHAASSGGANVARENEARKKRRSKLDRGSKGRQRRTQAGGAAANAGEPFPKRKRRGRKKKEDWQIITAAGIAGSVVLVVIGTLVITALEEFGVVI